MTLRSRLATGLVTIAIILVGPLVFAMQSLNRLRADAVQLRQEFAASLLLGRIRDGLSELRQQELGLLFVKGHANQATRDSIESNLRRLARRADSLSAFRLPEYATSIGTSIDQIADAARAEYGAGVANQTKYADSVSKKVFVPALNRADDAAVIAEHELLQRTSTRVADEADTISRTSRASAFALFLALTIAAWIAFRLTRSLSRPIGDLKSGMRAVADGDLAYHIDLPEDRIEELVELTESFRQMTRQLAELDKLKAEFVSVASHELKTPINVMIGYLQLLEDGIYGPLTQQQLDIHKTVGVQAHTLLRLVKQLLDVSRFDAGGGRLEPRAIRLDDLLGELERAFHVLAVQREIEFRVQRRFGLQDEVFWDLDRMNEVLGNLLSNAFKFTPHGGVVELTFQPAGAGVAMIVHDTGAGIPPEQLPRIFEKFYQADNQGAARAVGTGLGLAIAKQIVDAHGGTISCTSTVGVGTTITIEMPARVPRRSSPPPPRKAESNSA
jgi:signal transduction histidine kinase